MQYTLRNIPTALDRALRERARQQGKSLNQVAVAALARAVGLSETAVRARSLRELVGIWKDDPDFDAALENLHRIDENLWQNL